MIMSYEEIRHCLQNSKGSDVSRATKIGNAALSRLRKGRVTHPTYRTLQVLTEYFQANPVEEK
jgi:DNA-binding Xre family transcriptional regulator